MKRLGDWLLEQLERVPSKAGLPIVVAIGALFWIVVLTLLFGLL